MTNFHADRRQFHTDKAERSGLACCTAAGCTSHEPLASILEYRGVCICELSQEPIQLPEVIDAASAIDAVAARSIDNYFVLSLFTSAR